MVAVAKRRRLQSDVDLRRVLLHHAQLRQLQALPLTRTALPSQGRGCVHFLVTVFRNLQLF